MDMNRLHYFCTVVQAGSLVKASELLGISQPALSKAIKTLEAELDEKLVIPSGRGIAISDYGRAFAREAFPLVEKIHALKSTVLKGKELAPLRVASFEVFSTYFLGKVIAEDFQDIPVQVLELVPGPMEAAIAGGQADIGVTYLPIPHQDLDILKVATIEMGIYGSSNTFAKTPAKELPFVIPCIQVSGTPSKAKGIDGWPDHEIPRLAKFQVTMMETALDLCRRQVCVGYFPSFVIELHNQKVKPSLQLSRLKSPSELKIQKQDVYMIKRKSDLENSNFKKISRALRRLT
jgi:DNA-binding transcriptional LysR family regulator